MNMHSRLTTGESDTKARQPVPSPENTPVKTGLWKLLAAAAAILVGLALAMEFLSDDNSEFIESPAQEETNR